VKIYKKNEKGKNNRKVIFLLTGWRNRLWMYWPFAKILSLNGFYCITYAYDDEIFSPDTAKTVRYLTEVRDDVLITIKKLKKEGTKDFSIFGTSLGSMIALMIANNSKGVSKIILNTTGSDIAEIVWSWNKIFSWFKEDLLEQGFILDKLEKVWSSITPKNNTDQLKK
jgi:esterase/lipase